MEFNCFVNQIRVLTLVPMLFSSYKLIKEESTKSTGVQANDKLQGPVFSNYQ